MQSLRAVLTYCSAVIRSDADMTAAHSAVRQSMSKCNVAYQVIIIYTNNAKTANNWTQKLVVATDKLN